VFSLDDSDLIRTICAKIGKAESEGEVKALSALLRAVIKDDMEEIRVRARFFVEKHGLRDKASNRAA
jgi:hypothetical protein